MEQVCDFKDRGNKQFRAGCAHEAIDLYSQAIAIYSELDEQHHTLELKSDIAGVYSNRAACFLKLNRYSEVISDCDAALSIDGSRIKALYRRAMVGFVKRSVTLLIH